MALYLIGKCAHITSDLHYLSNILPSPTNISALLSPYRYQFEQMYLHWGSKNEHDNGVGSASGSEHAINGHFFPAEIQLYGFNADLFHNLSQGMMQPNGAVGVVIMIQESDRESNIGMKAIMSHLKKVCPYPLIYEKLFC